MSAQLTLVRVHEYDAVADIIRQAWQLVTDLDTAEEFQVPTFEKAVDLLAARIPILPQPMPISTGFVIPPDARVL